MNVRGVFLKEQLKCNCVCPLVNVSLPFRHPTRHQLCSRYMQTSSALTAHAVHMAVASGRTPVQMPPPHTPMTWIQSSDIYIDSVKLTL